jgi:uncharacterized protein YbjT (DUF2867 family)
MGLDVILFGATGMVGSAVLIECLEHPAVQSVLSIGRRPSGLEHKKLKEIVHTDFLDCSAIEKDLGGYNACFYCLGVSSVGMSRDEYRRITVQYTQEAAEVLSRLNPGMTFCFISGAGTDDTLRSRQHWARVKGEAENMLKALPFKSVYLMRPAYIQPRKDAVRVLWMYRILGPFYRLWKLLFPNHVMRAEDVGRAMIAAALHGAEKQTLESSDMVRLAKEAHA